MEKKLPALTINWSDRDNIVSEWLSSFPDNTKEIVIKEIIKDYILYSETNNPIPMVEALKNMQAPKTDAPDPIKDVSLEDNPQFTDELGTSSLTKEGANEKLENILKTL